MADSVFEHSQARLDSEREDSIAQLVGEGYFNEAAALSIGQAATYLAGGDAVTARAKLIESVGLVDAHLQAHREGVGLPAYSEAIEVETPHDSSWDDVCAVHSDLLTQADAIRQRDSYEWRDRGYAAGQIRDIVSLIEAQVDDKSEEEKLLFIAIFCRWANSGWEDAYDGTASAIRHVDTPHLKALALAISPHYESWAPYHNSSQKQTSKAIYRELSETEQVQFYVDYLTLCAKFPSLQSGWRARESSGPFIKQELAAYTKNLNALIARCGRDVIDIDRAQWKFPEVTVPARKPLFKSVLKRLIG